MISFLTSPKAFKNEYKTLQARAIQSWKNTHPDSEVILYNNEEGVAEAASALGVRHVPDIATSARGVPRFDAMVTHAAREARHDLQAYMNCDILLAPDFLARVGAVKPPKFLIVGQCFNLTKDADIALDASDWTREVRRLYRDGHASVRPVSAMDYFVFPRGLWTGLEPLICGRAYYDQALVAFCLRRKIPTVDASREIIALHQYHDYTFLAGGHNEAVYGEEAAFNRMTHGLAHSGPSVADADFQLRDGSLERANCRGDRLRALEIELRFRRGMRLPAHLVRALWRLLRRARVRSDVELTMEQMLD